MEGSNYNDYWRVRQGFGYSTLIGHRVIDMMQVDIRPVWALIPTTTVCTSVTSCDLSGLNSDNSVYVVSYWATSNTPTPRKRQRRRRHGRRVLLPRAPDGVRVRRERQPQRSRGRLLQLPQPDAQAAESEDQERRLLPVPYLSTPGQIEVPCDILSGQLFKFQLPARCTTTRTIRCAGCWGRTTRTRRRAARPCRIRCSGGKIAPTTDRTRFSNSASQ